jgi:Ca2+/H+ antiporter, TMEM165/GDT1 family
MDALIPAFIAVLLAETGDRVQTQTHRLALSYAALRPVWLALGLSGLLTFGLAAAGGALLVDLINYRARTLFLGVALLAAGIPMLMRIKAAAAVSPTRPFVTSLIRIVPALLASGSLFLITAIAARTAMPGLTMAGGFAAMLLAAALPMLLRDEWPGALPLALLRQIAGGILIAAGLWMGLTALQLI